MFNRLWVIIPTVMMVISLNACAPAEETADEEGLSSSVGSLTLKCGDENCM